MITLIGSMMYVLAWQVSFSFLPGDFTERMWQHFIEKAKNEASNEAELNATLQQIETWKEWYKNPLLRFVMTLMEIVPVGVVITLISATILRKKQVLPA